MEHTPMTLPRAVNVEKLYTLYHITMEDPYRFPGEQHPFWEMDCVLRGSAGITSGSEVFRLEAGEAILHPPGRFHKLWTDGEDCEMFWFSFDGTGLADFLTPGKYRLGREDLERIGGILAIAGSVPGFTSSGCLASLPERAPESQLLRLSLEALCLSLWRRRADTAQPRSDAAAWLFSSIIAYWQEHAEDGVSMEETARALGCSTDRISRILHRFAGMSPVRYYLRIRCERAAALLLSGESVSRTAEKMNFSSPYYFSCFFRRETGMTPREYVRRNASAGEEN